MQKINKFNQYLLEKYPTVWNTKLVWMLLAAFVFHVIFFVIGYLSHIDPVTLQTTYVKDDYFRHGLILVHIIISVLMIVVWLIMMFKNNAFKNFYPQSQGKLFGQFVQYFVIIFASTTFYFSYMTGFKMFINHKYPDSEMVKNVETINRATAFLSQNANLYTLDERLYPKPFYDLYCETDLKKIDRNNKYFVFYKNVYQFYKLYSKTSNEKDAEKDFLIPEPERSAKKEVVYSESSEDGKFRIFYFKKEVVDVSAYVKSTGFSYYNYSDVFYDNDVKSFDDGVGAIDNSYGYYDKNLPDYKIKSKKALINEKTTRLLDKNNSDELQKLLADFLRISKEFSINNNLDADKWAKMVYNPTDFEVKYFIKKYKPEPGDEYDPLNSEYDRYAIDSVATTADYDSTASVVDGKIVNDSIQIREFNPDINKQISPEKYFKNNITDYYYYTDNLKDFLESVDEIKNFDFFTMNIHIYLWIAFCLATFIMSFRMTGLKSLLFSIISAGVLSLAVTLLNVLYSFSGAEGQDFFAGYSILFISLFILSVPIFMVSSFNKLVTSVFVNLSLNGFVLFVLLIFGLISIHQRAACRDLANTPEHYPYTPCTDVFDALGLWISIIILIFGFIFMYFYSSVIMKWKARPE